MSAATSSCQNKWPRKKARGITVELRTTIKGKGNRKITFWNMWTAKQY